MSWALTAGAEQLNSSSVETDFLLQLVDLEPGVRPRQVHGQHLLAISCKDRMEGLGSSWGSPRMLLIPSVRAPGRPQRAQLPQPSDGAGRDQLGAGMSTFMTGCVPSGILPHPTCALGCGHVTFRDLHLFLAVALCRCGAGRGGGQSAGPMCLSDPFCCPHRHFLANL